MGNQLYDISAERALLGTIAKHGKDALIDCGGILAASDFHQPINRAIFSCFLALEEDNIERYDPETIVFKAKSIGLSQYFEGKKEQEYLSLIEASTFDKSNIQVFALQIKKYSIARDLLSRYTSAADYVANITGSETISEIITNSENKIVDFINGIESNDSLELLTKDMNEYAKQLLEAEEVQQIGIPTPYAKWDQAIGGGLRKATINVIAARPKASKSFLAMNNALFIARTGIPVLYLDTEMTYAQQKPRMLAIDSNCPLHSLETSKFKHTRNLVDKVVNSAKEINNMPLTYKSIAGMTHIEALAYARRWLVKCVGFNEQGLANDCVIVYDYLKLTGINELSKVTAEYIALGIMMADMHNFAVKHQLPVLAFVQLNREGIDSDDSSIIAGSDRILWLCSNMSVLRNKNENDVELGCGFEFGNKKLSIMETRYGSGFENENDYLNLLAKLRPRVTEFEGTGRITEGNLYSQVVGNHGN